MNIPGSVTFDDATNLYAVAIPLLGLWTQGEILDDGLFMAEDGLKMLHPDIKFTLSWASRDDGTFIVTSPDKRVIPIILKEARLTSKKSLMEVAKELGYSNQNSVYAYETGAREPSVSKFQQLLAVYGVAIEMQQRAA